jgi:uncharacterized membrane-anchored protein YitT (DUF2179 family)
MASASRPQPNPPVRRSRWVAVRQTVVGYLGITLGVTLMALANDLFLLPNNVFSGGVTGIALLLEHFTGGSVGTLYFLFNVPLLLAGMRWLGGWRFLARTLYAVTLLSVLIDAFHNLVPPITQEPILYTLYGGLIDGVGVGLVFRAHGTTGGSDIVALLLNRFRGVAINQSLLGFDAAVYVLAAVFFGPDRALYALISSYAGSRAVALVQEGLRYTRIVYIVSTAPDEIAGQIMSEIGRGVTFLSGTGGYTGAPYRVILAVIRQQELNLVVDTVREIDPQAFVIIGDAREVMGEGFNPLPPRAK